MKSVDNSVQWVVLTEIFHPDEAQLVSGLLSMAGIPVKVERESAGDLFGLTVGPLARIAILVPRERLPEAERVLDGEAGAAEPDEK